MHNQNSKRLSSENCKVYSSYCLNCASSTGSSCSGDRLTVEYQDMSTQTEWPRKVLYESNRVCQLPTTKIK
uniref:Uncharacterized protein n=1 Tax=Arion vulgaris TaxID=1028688 RepID=A0A0B6ZSD8_9EUPU